MNVFYALFSEYQRVFPETIRETEAEVLSILASKYGCEKPDEPLPFGLCIGKISGPEFNDLFIIQGQVEWVRGFRSKKK